MSSCKIFYVDVGGIGDWEQWMEKKGPQRRRGRRRLRVIKQLISSRHYQYSAKVQRYIEEGFFDLEDMERCVLSAIEIDKVEVDELETAVDGCKYTIIGVDTQGLSFYTCGKLIRNIEAQQLYFFITAHEQE
jgi:hypothetical protein